MSYLSVHLEQIGYSCQGIDSLPIFTNALLSNHDITSLIRDTEAHERALFSVPPPPPPAVTTQQQQQQQQQAEEQQTSSGRRRRTVFNVSSGEVTTGPPARGAHPKRHTAVAAVLGGEMHEQLSRHGRGGADGKSSSSGNTGSVDVEVLLRGAEKLCGVYELPGARERIAALRMRHRNGTSTMAYYEAKVAGQAEVLTGLNKDWMEDDEEDDGEGEGWHEEVWTEEDLRREEEDAREMERKKRELQARLRAMEKDLGGLMSM